MRTLEWDFGIQSGTVGQHTYSFISAGPFYLALKGWRDVRGRPYLRRVKLSWAGYVLFDRRFGRCRQSMR